MRHPRVLRISSRMVEPGNVLIAVADTVRGSTLRRWTPFSMPSSRRSPKEWEWGCRSAGRSSRPMGVACGIAKFASRSIFQFTVPAAAKVS